MKQLTIRGFGPELERKLRATARQNGVSLNKAALQLLRRGAGLEPTTTEPDAVGTALDGFIGQWTAADERQLLHDIQVFEAIDAEMWK